VELICFYLRVFIGKKIPSVEHSIKVCQLFVKASFQCFMAQMKPTLRAGVIKKGHSELTQIYKSSQNCVCNSLLLDEESCDIFLSFQDY